MGVWRAGCGLLVPVVPVLAAAVMVGAGSGTAGAAANCVSSAGARAENPGSGNGPAGAAVVSSCRAGAMGGYSSGTAQPALTGPSWQKVPSLNPGSGRNILSAVAATSATDAWAVGIYANGTTFPRTLIAGWNGKTWKQAPSPNPGSGNNILSGVAATSAASAWAVGYSSSTAGANRTLTAHWDGKTWKQVPSPNPGVGIQRLSGVAAISASDAWAVGFYSSGTGVDRTLITHWDGKTWKQVPSPSPGTARNYLSSVAATSATNAWAVGADSNGSTYQTLIVHWNGKTWTKVPSPNPGSGNNVLSGVAATSATDAWAVGSYSSGTGGNQTLIAHWNGKTWAKVPSPNPGSNGNTLYGVVATSAADAWAVGTGGNQTLTLHCC